MSYSTQNKEGIELNRVYKEDLPVHEWYRFVLSFPPHLVRKYLEYFSIGQGMTVLDPFCGTGTTLVETKKHGIYSVGIEANPIAHLASKVKTNWNLDRNLFLENSNLIARKAEQQILIEGNNLRTLNDIKLGLIITDSISPLPLHKVLILLDVMSRNEDQKFREHQMIALAKNLVYSYSNLRFGPEVGVSRKKKDDVDVVGLWIKEIESMAQDMESVHQTIDIPSRVILGDSREINKILPKNSIDAVITSPPYPNEKDYTRTTRLESVLLGFIKDKADLRNQKQGLLRSNTRNVYKLDRDDLWIKDNKRVSALSAKILQKRIELNKTSGFEKLYNRVVELYFGGITKHLENLKLALKPNARLAYVVGDQASYFRVMIRTGEITAEIAESLGYKVERIDLFRTRLSTATGEYLREEVVVLRWPG